MTKLTTEALQKAFDIIAYSSLKENHEPVTPENIEAESGRIERCVEHHYKIDKKCVLDYPEFASKFLKENYHDIVFTTKYVHDYLDDVSDKVIEKEYYLEDAKFIF